jgi:hypothetical protein
LNEASEEPLEADGAAIEKICFVPD